MPEQTKRGTGETTRAVVSAVHALIVEHRDVFVIHDQGICHSRHLRQMVLETLQTILGYSHFPNTDKHGDLINITIPTPVPYSGHCPKASFLTLEEYSKGGYPKDRFIVLDGIDLEAASMLNEIDNIRGQEVGVSTPPAPAEAPKNITRYPRQMRSC